MAQTDSMWEFLDAATRRRRMLGLGSPQALTACPAARFRCKLLVLITLCKLLGTYDAQLSICPLRKLHDAQAA